MRVAIPDGYDSGCFVRIIWWPEDEINTLAQREAKKPKKPPAPSMVTFVRQGYPGYLRGTVLGYEDCTQLSYETHDLGDAFGLFLRTDWERPIEWFFTGVGKLGPDDATWQYGKRYDNGSGSYHQTWNVTPPHILQVLEELRRIEGPTKPLPVNEGFLDYRAEDVVAILVNPASVKSIAKAAGFLKGVLKTTEAEVGFYSYNPLAGDVTHHSLEALKSQKHCKLFPRKFRDYANFYETIWEAAP